MKTNESDADANAQAITRKKCRELKRELEAIEAENLRLRFEALNTKIDNKFDNVNNKVNNKFDTLNTKIDNKFDNVDNKVNNMFDTLNTKIDNVDNKIDSVAKAVDNVKVGLVALACLTVAPSLITFLSN